MNAANDDGTGMDARRGEDGEAVFRIEPRGFVKIAAVEGLEPTRAAVARAEGFDETGLSPQQRRQAIIDAHRPKA